MGNNNPDDFFEGVAAVRDPRPLHIDTKGNTIDFTPYEVDEYRHFSNGLILASLAGRFAYLDRAGRPVITGKFDTADDFSEGMAKIGLSGKFGYIDRTGEVVIAPRFLLASRFSDGATRVVVQGPCVIGLGVPCADVRVLGVPPVDSRMIFKHPPCRYGFAGRSGNLLFPQSYADAAEFSEGLAAVKGDAGNWGFVDKTGALRIPYAYDGADPFSEGLASVLLDRKLGYIDQAGREIIRPQYQTAGEFSAGAAVVSSSYGNYWFIDTNGNRLFGRTFQAAGGFRLGLASVQDKQGYAYIDRYGRTVFR